MDEHMTGKVPRKPNLYTVPQLRVVRLQPEERLMTCGKVGPSGGYCGEELKVAQQS